MRGNLGIASRPRVDRDWTVGFIERFEEHQVERIRRAILAYRDKHDIGDVRLIQAMRKHLPKNMSYDASLKNAQRLREGKRMRGADFLNACVQFLEVEMATPPEEELGLAMKRFVGDAFGYAALWADVGGDYVLRVLGERTFDFPAGLGQPDRRVTAIAVSATGKKPPEAANAPVVLSISQGEGMDYGVARERFFLPDEDGPAQEQPAYSEANALSRKGVCLPVGAQDMIVMIRDFLLSHMYVLKREPFGFAGTMIIPSPYEFFAAEATEGMPQSQYDVVLRRVPRE